MGLSNMACDALDVIEDAEGQLTYVAAVTGEDFEYKGYPWDELRVIKLELHIIYLEQ